MTKLSNKRETMGLGSAVTPYEKFSSASRKVMAFGMGSQALGSIGAELSPIMHGLEAELSKYTFKCIVPCDCEVVEVLSHHVQTPDEREAGITPPKTIVFQSLEDGTYDYIDVVNYHSTHEQFGHTFVVSDIAKNVRKGQILYKDTILAEGTNNHNGMYSTTVEANVAYLSVGASIEDGFEISRQWLNKCTPIEILSSYASWGKKKYPVNLYGTENDYRPFPAPGERIRSDGLVFALRDFDPVLDSVNMLSHNLQKPDLVNDELVYGTPNAIIHDIKILTTTKDSKRANRTPVGMEALCERYYSHRENFNKRLKDTISRVTRNARTGVLSPRLQRLVTEAIADRPNEFTLYGRRDADIAGNVERTLNAVPIDEWTVEVFYHSEFDLDEGAKLSNLYGGKGVPCRIRDESEMPIDRFGNRVDIIAYGRGVTARMNIGQLYEQHAKAVNRDVHGDIVKMCAEHRHSEALSYLEEYYQLYPDQWRIYSQTKKSKEDRMKHLEHVLADNIRIVLPADNEYIGASHYRALESFRSPNMSEVLYTNYDGSKEWTKEKVLIGGQSIMVLEKSAHKPMAESTSRLQNNGLPASSNKKNKYSRPSRHIGSRVIGEAEGRAHAAACGGLVVAEALELSTNPEVTEAAVTEMFTHEIPSRIEKLVDRKEIPLGDSRAIGFAKHLIGCGGAEIVSNKDL